ncbi:hypothetical protein DPMN_059103 [Dreissena polymorpha]|uniref:Dynein heavy chain linker domain-containing protein n=1 Tax=Dreissena polymorpha TaxID=45954 RepID=A0A9D4C2Y3_DREPO|nr:hypothetical protein DPMN_059103 [Dreissena polymorpha]
MIIISIFITLFACHLTSVLSGCLQDSQISIAGMMQSPYLGDMTAEVESWASALQQVEEIADLWYTCQKKVNAVFITHCSLNYSPNKIK